VPTLHVTQEAASPENADEVTVFIDGFATRDGSWASSNVAKPLQSVNDSTIWALEYANNQVSVPEIAAEIAKKAERDGVHSVSLYGYSIGGMVALETAVTLVNEYNLNVPTIFLDHSPADGKSIRESVREQASPAIDAIELFHSVGIDIEYSSIAREFINRFSGIDITYLKNTSLSLMLDQYLYGTSADTNRFMEILGKQTPNIEIRYVTSTDPSIDDTIDLVRSEDMYEDMSEKYDIPFYTIPVEGATHGRIDLAAKQYETAFIAAAHDIELQKKVATYGDIPFLATGNSPLHGGNGVRGEQYDQNKTESNTVPDK
jgi:pimeloyl-ACP methyl ester carboxylesterase